MKFFNSEKSMIEPLLQEIHQQNALYIAEIEKSKNTEALKLIANLKRALGTMKAISNNNVELPIDESYSEEPVNTKICPPRQISFDKKRKPLYPQISQGPVIVLSKPIEKHYLSQIW